MQMGKNPGTIDASAYLIVVEGARCQNASAFSESIPRTGKPFDNIRSGRFDDFWDEREEIGANVWNGWPLSTRTRARSRLLHALVVKS